ncbi:hypothetical protein BJV74DRAFT_953048 [Russula compacta]|nr:hypothetical protein BJV74DRAFT_953048 [Russula compacta]
MALEVAARSLKHVTHKFKRDSISTKLFSIPSPSRSNTLLAILSVLYISPVCHLLLIFNGPFCSTGVFFPHLVLTALAVGTAAAAAIGTAPVPVSVPAGLAGSIAAGMQAGIGNVAAGSLFAIAQSVAMGGAVPGKPSGT